MKHVKPYCRWRLASTSCAIALVALIAVVPWRVVAQEAPPEPGSTPLAEAVKQFNAEAAVNKFGKDQPALTEDEVVAAIRWTLHEKPFADATKAEYAALEKVANTNRLPKDARFEVQTGFRPGDELDYTIWSVRLQMPRDKPYLTYGFPIRDRFVTVERTDPYSTDNPPSRRRFSNSLRPAAEKIDESLPTLADAVKKFNAEAAKHKLGKNQPPLTEDEVTAALYWTELGRKLKGVTDKEYAAIEQVAKTGRLPKNADFEVVTGFIPGDGWTYENWSVRLRMPSEKAGSHNSFIVREQFMSVRPTDPEETDSPRAKGVSGKNVIGAAEAVAAVLESPEPPPLDSSGKASTASSVADPQTKTEKDIKKLLIGTWRCGSGKLTIREDGTATIFAAPASRESKLEEAATAAPHPQTLHGGWRIDGDQFIFLPNREGGGVGEMKSTIARLDDSYLRLKPANLPASFYRRATLPPLEDLVGKIPPEIHRLAQLAELDSEEAISFAEWNNQSHVIGKTDMDRLKRFHEASEGKIGYKELFQFTDAEHKAYLELMKLSGKNFVAAASLVDQGVLTSEETAAMKNAISFSEWFAKLNGVVHRLDPKRKHDETNSSERDLEAAKRKLLHFLDRLSLWASSSGPYPLPVGQ